VAAGGVWRRTAGGYPKNALTLGSIRSGVQ
jgi:hypothetical protein